MTRWFTQPRSKLRQGRPDSPYEEIRVINPSRGLNLLVADILANDKEATAGTRNVEYIEGGAVTKRPGYTAQGTGLVQAGAGLGVYTSEAANYPICSDGGVLKKYQSGSWSTLAGAVTLDSTSQVSFTSLFEKTYAWDGTNGGVVFDGTTVTRPGTMPKAKFSVVYKGWHVAAGVDGQPFRLYFAKRSEPSRFTDSIVPTDPDDVALNNSTEVPGATVFAGAAGPQAIDINILDGQYVTGLGFFQDVLIVFKERSIFQLYFNESGGFVVERISSSYGCVAHGSIASVENDCYFLTEKGVYVLGNEPNFYASIRTNELSSRIRTLLQSIRDWSKCRAIYHDDRYWLIAPVNSDDADLLIVYDRRFYAWAVWDNIYANDLMVFTDKDGNNRNHFYFLDNRSANMQEFIWGTYDDNGDPISQVFRTRAFEGKRVDREKFWYVVRPILRRTNGDVNISYITEEGSVGRPIRLTTTLSGGLGTDEFGALLLGSSEADEYTLADLGLDDSDFGTSTSTDNSTSVYDIGATLDSRTLKVEFKNENLNEYFTLLGWVVLYRTKDSARFDGDFTFR